MEASSSKATRWTYAEFARLPSEGSARHEVIAGELDVTPAPSKRHERIATDLVTWLNGFVHEHDRLDIVTDRGVEALPDPVVGELIEAAS